MAGNGKMVDGSGKAGGRRGSDLDKGWGGEGLRGVGRECGERAVG